MKEDRLYLSHILDAVEKIESYVSVGRAEFMDASHWQDAVIRQLMIIGEATKRLSQKLRDDNEDVPWVDIAGMRDVLVHDYAGVNLDLVWQVTQANLPSLKRRVREILDETKAEG